MRETKRESVDKVKLFGIEMSVTVANLILPLFLITVCLVFSFVFTVMLVPLREIPENIKALFIVMIVTTTIVTSSVGLVLYHLLLFDTRRTRR